MALSTELAALFRRDLTRLAQEVGAFPDEAMLWAIRPGVANSAGHLTLHLEGNLREYVGRQLGGIPYTRDRPLEFSSPALPAAELMSRVNGVKDSIPGVIETLTSEQLDVVFPEQVLGTPLTTRQFLMHLFGHLSYHLGQVDYLRRLLTEGPSIKFAGL